MTVDHSTDLSITDAKPQTESSASVTKALRLLDVFRSHGPVLGVSELARQAGVAKSTAFRLLALLEEAELVERDGRGYRLGWRLFELGSTVQRRWPSGLRDISAPWLTELYVNSGQVVSLSVLDSHDILVLDKISGPRSPRTPASVGARIPAHCTAAGKVILAFSQPTVVRDYLTSPLTRLTRYSVAEPGRLQTELRKVRSTGIALAREEMSVGLVSMSSPIVLGANVIAAVSVLGPATRFDWSVNETLLRKTTRRIAVEMGADAAASSAGL